MSFAFDNSWARDLPSTFLRQNPDIAPNPRLLVLNVGLAQDLGLDSDELSLHGAAWFSGASLPLGADPLALAYAGHQFGGFSPSLGDGRAHLLGEFLAPDGRRFDLQLKGSGRTPFSRGGDGKAALAPMLREYIISEAMAGLNIPTSRSLAVCLTGETILRDRGPVAGAVLARIASSHIRIGSFEFFNARDQVKTLRELADYAITRHYPHLAQMPRRFMGLFDAVTGAQSELIAAWMAVGFVHGVMNTDNMTISGETIDYGPCAFLDTYQPATVFSSVDRQGRYAFGNQPKILTWNLARFAESLLPLLLAEAETEAGLSQAALVEELNARLDGVSDAFQRHWLRNMRRKLGLVGEEAGDLALAQDFMRAITGADFTLAFYHLGDASRGNAAALMALGGEAAALEAWLPRWRMRLRGQAVADGVNPAVIARNHNVEAALSAAEQGDMAPLHRLVTALRRPFEFDAALSQPAPESFGRYVTFCGT